MNGGRGGGSRAKIDLAKIMGLMLKLKLAQRSEGIFFSARFLHEKELENETVMTFWAPF